VIRRYVSRLTERGCFGSGTTSTTHQLASDLDIDLVERRFGLSTDARYRAMKADSVAFLAIRGYRGCSLY
jgi:hypothetical protein